MACSQIDISDVYKTICNRIVKYKSLYDVDECVGVKKGFFRYLTGLSKTNGFRMNKYNLCKGYFQIVTGNEMDWIDEWELKRYGYVTYWLRAQGEG
jgi:hypothetical protein